MTRRLVMRAALATIVLVVAVPRVHAQSPFDPTQGFNPLVPVSAFAHSASWFDPSRLHLASTVTVGSDFSGSSSALQVTSLSYQFRAPFSLSVSVGNTFGTAGATSSGSPFFLEGLDLAWRPTRNSLFRVEMHNYRSPLQLGGWGRGYGVPGFTSPY